MPYTNRDEIRNRVTWAGSWIQAITYGLVEPAFMPDDETKAKAQEVQDAWGAFQNACGQLYQLIKDPSEDEPA